jgi:beta-phosphoglucomutase
LDIILKWATASCTASEKTQLLTDKNNHYLELIGSLSTRDILPGVVDFLELLRLEGLKTAVGSSSKNARYILDKLTLTHHFDAIVDGTMVKQTKPDPEVFVNAAALLAISPAECLVIEDAEAGVAAARAAGMKVLGIDAHGHLKDADHSVENLVGLDTVFINKHFS